MNTENKLEEDKAKVARLLDLEADAISCEVAGDDILALKRRIGEMQRHENRWEEWMVEQIETLETRIMRLEEDAEDIADAQKTRERYTLSPADFKEWGETISENLPEVEKVDWTSFEAGYLPTQHTFHNAILELKRRMEDERKRLNWFIGVLADYKDKTDARIDALDNKYRGKSDAYDIDWVFDAAARNRNCLIDLEKRIKDSPEESAISENPPGAEEVDWEWVKRMGRYSEMCRAILELKRLFEEEQGLEDKWARRLRKRIKRLEEKEDKR